MRQFNKLCKLGLMVIISTFSLLSDSGHIASADKIGTTDQVELMEYVYDENGRLVEIRLSGAAIAVLTYDNNGNLLGIQIIQ